MSAIASSSDCTTCDTVPAWQVIVLVLRNSKPRCCCCCCSCALRRIHSAPVSAVDSSPSVRPRRAWTGAIGPKDPHHTHRVICVSDDRGAEVVSAAGRDGTLKEDARALGLGVPHLLTAQARSSPFLVFRTESTKPQQSKAMQALVSCAPAARGAQQPPAWPAVPCGWLGA